MSWEEHPLVQELEKDLKLIVLHFLSSYDTLEIDKKAFTVLATIELAKRLLVRFSYNDLLRMHNDDRINNLISLKGVISNVADMLENRKGFVDATKFPLKYSKSGEEYIRYAVSMLYDNAVTAIREEAKFVAHCDDASCDLGTLQCTCLNCNKPLIDYDNWWNKDGVMQGLEVMITCYRCGRPMWMKKDGDVVWLKRERHGMAIYADLKME